MRSIPGRIGRPNGGIDPGSKPSVTEGKLCQALEHIEAILNRRRNAFVNEDAETRKMRGIIETALKERVKARTNEILAGLPPPKDIPRH